MNMKTKTSTTKMAWLLGLTVVISLVTPLPSFAGAGTALGRMLARLTERPTAAEFSKMALSDDAIKQLRTDGGYGLRIGINDDVNKSLIREAHPNSHGSMIYYSTSSSNRARVMARYQLHEGGNIEYFDINTGQLNTGVRPDDPNARPTVEVFLPDSRRDTIQVQTVLREKPGPPGGRPLTSMRYDEFRVVQTPNRTFRQTASVRYVDASFENGIVRNFEVRVDGDRIIMNGNHQGSNGDLVGAKFNYEFSPDGRVLHAEMDESLREIRYVVLDADGNIQVYSRKIEPFDDDGVFRATPGADQTVGPRPATPEQLELMTAEARTFETGARQISTGATGSGAVDGGMYFGGQAQ
jgi:hypothetical protein